MMKDDWTLGCDVKADVPDDQKGRHYDVFEEVALIAHYLKRQGVLAAIEEQVHFARRRFGHYEMIDFVAVLLSYAISGEHTLEAFYECLQPFAHTFMALFGQERLPHRSTLSRFLAALDQAQARSITDVVSRRFISSPAGKIGEARRVVGSTGKPLGSVRCRWHRGLLLANELYLARLIARQHNAG